MMRILNWILLLSFMPILFLGFIWEFFAQRFNRGREMAKIIMKRLDEV